MHSPETSPLFRRKSAKPFFLPDAEFAPSYQLRHQPEDLNLPEVRNAEGHPRRLERGGWASIDLVLEGIRPSFPITREDLLEIVRTSDKQRLGISADGLKIRANQGHSCEVDMECAF
jgi:putative RNA 2'-phosphotransferase